MKNKRTVLLIGLGEIGRPIFEILQECGRFTVYGLDLDETKMHVLGLTKEGLPRTVDVMHVCIPCVSKGKFVEIVTDYAKKFRPKLLIIDSTVPPTTTSEIHRNCNSLVAHSPVYGTHKNLEYMKWEMKRWTKVIGAVNAESAKAASRHFQDAGIKTRILSSPVETELTKLFETVYTAWMIIFFQEMHRICKQFGASLEDVVDSIGEIHQTRLDRPVWYPNVIGGHCLIPNTELLLNAYDSEFFRLILESNEKRKREIKDRGVLEEVEKVKKRVEILQKELINRLDLH